MFNLKNFNWKKFLLVNLGVLILAVGVYFFKMPNNFSTGGVTGLSIILAKFITILTSTDIMVVLNIVLLLIGFIFLGKGFGVYTVYASIMFSLETWLFGLFLPLSSPLSSEPFMELCIAVLITSVGSAILFNCSASSGGTDIVAMIFKKYTHLNVGKALLLTDSIIAFSSFFVFNIETGLFSVLGLFAKCFLVDGVIENFNICKYFTIITVCPDEICEFIIKELKHGVTKQEAVGQYTNETKFVLLTAVKRTDAIKLRNHVKNIDPNAFIMIANTSEIIGKGFRGV